MNMKINKLTRNSSQKNTIEIQGDLFIDKTTKLEGVGMGVLSV